MLATPQTSTPKTYILVVMKLYKNKQAGTIILERGEELVSSLKIYAKENDLAGAWLTSGLGGSGSVTLSFYDLETRSYLDKTFDEPLEILSLEGNLAWVDDEPFWHVHGVFGRRDYSTLSGHVQSLTIALTGELLITPLETKLTRTYDEATGLKLLS